MKFLLSDTNEIKEITVKSWNGSGYGPDCFYDLETNFTQCHETVDADGTYICTSKEYEDLKFWWEEEILAMNNGIQNNDLDYSEHPDKNICIFAD